MKLPKLHIGDLTANIPIIQGGMGIGVSLSGLAGAVAREGGIGVISAAQVGFNEPDFRTNTVKANIRALKEQIHKAREKAKNGIIGINIMWRGQHYEDYARTAAESGADIIFSGAGLPADLPVSRLRTVVEAWAFRTAEISKMEGIEQIFPFENHGQEIGVSLAHPHGQVYCYPFIAPKMEAELKQTEAYHEKTGGNLLKDLMNSEIEAGERIVMRNHSWVAYVPAAARWPLEVHVAPVRDVLTLDELNDQERWDLAVMYSTLLKRGNAFFDKGDGKGMDLPYIAAWHQAPIHDARRENYRLNLQFFSFRRAANKIKYLAGSESGMAAWVSDTTPELIAKRFHELGPIDIEG